MEFSRRHQASPRTLAAFDQSQYTDDWRDLMRLYLVRRTRSFIQDNYAETDPATKRKFLTYEDGSKSFFPSRVPKTIKFAIDDKDPKDQYARLYAQEVVNTVNELRLPRYGLGKLCVRFASCFTHSSRGAADPRPLPRGAAADGILPDQTSSSALKAAVQPSSSQLSVMCYATMFFFMH